MEEATATLGDCAAYARQRLPRWEADALVCRALQVPRSHLYAFTECAAEPADAIRMADWISRRVHGEPMAYILGERGFWGLDLAVTPAALIPRPDTELLVAAALEHIHSGDRVLDIGTGCGAVALAIASEHPDARVVATDVDPRCIALCRRNAARHGLHIETRVADCFAGLDLRFDVVVSNPPYIAEGDRHLRQGDLRFEPRRALVGGPNRGLDFIARLVRDATHRLEPGGWLCVEHGCDQADAVHDLFREQGIAAVRNHRDLEDRPRVTVGCLP